MNDYQILHGDALTMLRTLPSGSVHCVVTSPPYYGLRSYLPAGHPDKALEIGLDKTVGAYVARLVEVCEEVRRVLRDDGTLWLNLGDSYNGSGGSGGDYGPGGLKEGQPKYPGRRVDSLKPKDLIGIPWRVAFALQDAGWWLRSDIIWAKRAPMPESVTDRPTRSHEHIFLLTKASRYFYDAEAVREAFADERMGNPGAYKWAYANDPESGKGVRGNGGPSVKLQAEGWNADGAKTGRNQRDLWTLGPEPYAAAHFATFPTEIPRRAILAGTSERGCCPACGAPWRRVVEREHLGATKGHRPDPGMACPTGKAEGSNTRGMPSVPSTTTGWRPTCLCPGLDGDAPWPDLTMHPDGEANWPTIPCTVLDPFGGSGTTAAVAVGLGRRAILCELNAEYIKLAEARISNTQRPLGI